MLKTNPTVDVKKVTTIEIDFVRDGKKSPQYYK